MAFKHVIREVGKIARNLGMVSTPHGMIGGLFPGALLGGDHGHHKHRGHHGHHGHHHEELEKEKERHKAAHDHHEKYKVY